MKLSYNCLTETAKDSIVEEMKTDKESIVEIAQVVVEPSIEAVQIIEEPIRKRYSHRDIEILITKHKTQSYWIGFNNERIPCKDRVMV